MFFYIFMGFMVVVLVLIITAIAQPPNKLVERITAPKTLKKRIVKK